MLLHNLSSTILLIACFWPSNSQQHDITQPEVTITQGTLQGTIRTTRGNRIVSTFLAIPYAKPPIGNLRFANPVAADGWTGTKDASVDGNKCPQESGGAEDCLTINVYTPKLPKDSSSSLLPVMVWIYGGAFRLGSHNSAEFGPEYLLDKDVVLAVPNHRVGPFGFLSTGDEVASGNWGLKDQVLALQWVQDNIKYFGGDPNQVTLFGQSAGAASVHLLTLSDATKGEYLITVLYAGPEAPVVEVKPLVKPKSFLNWPLNLGRCGKVVSDRSGNDGFNLKPLTTLPRRLHSAVSYGNSPRHIKGLFHRYITQSGSALATWAHQPRAAYASRAFELGEYVGCSNDTSASLIACLRGIEASDIVASYSKFSVWNHLPGIVWLPTDEPDIDGAVLTDSPANIFASGRIRDLPWISGVARDEGLLHNSPLYENEEMFDDYLDKFDTVSPQSLTLMFQSDSGAAWVKAIKSYYFNDDLTTNKPAILKNLTLFESDALFFYPNHNARQQHLKLAVNPQYFYTFNYRGALSYTIPMIGSYKDYGVMHSDELIYLFPNTALFSSLDVARSESDFQMVDTMVELWTSFAINGTPTNSARDNTVTWEPYSTEDNYLRIGSDSDPSLEVRYSFFKERMEFWDSLYSATSSPGAPVPSKKTTQTHHEL